MKNTYMYHYTSFESFLKIWANKELKFSSSFGVGDINEVSKFYWSEHRPHEFTDTELLRKEVESYKQISLTKESKNLYMSCMLPVMWGQYGGKGKGVCLRIDLSKINFTSNIYRGDVKYKDSIKPITYNNSELTEFIIKNQQNLFFQKTEDWKYENEYRIVSKDKKNLDISNAIQEIIITNIFGMYEDDENSGGFRSTLFNQVLKPLIPDSIKILEFCPNGLNGYSLVNEKGEKIFPSHENIDNVDFN